MKSITIFFLTFLVLIVTSESITANTPNTPADDGKIMGSIADNSQNEKIEYANIMLFNSTDSTLITGTITNANGEFVMEKVPYGKYYIIADFIGYNKKMIKDIELDKKHKTINLETITLEQAVEILQEAEVSAERNLVDLKIDKKVVNVSKNVNAQGGTAVEALQNVPGVNVDVDGNVTVRGSGSYTVLIDGKPSPIQGSDALKQLPAEIIENIEIITNPSAKYDPDGTSGIINVILKKDKKDGINGMVSVNYGTIDKYGGNLNLNIRNNKINYFINSSYNKHPNYADSYNERENYIDTNTSFLTETTERLHTRESYRVNTGVDYTMNDKNSVTISGTLGYFGFGRDFDTKYKEWNNYNDDINYISSNNKYDLTGTYYAGNLFHQYKINGGKHKIETSVTAWDWVADKGETSNQYITNSDYIKTNNAILTRTGEDENKLNIKAKIDYSVDIKESKLEAGLQVHINPGKSSFNLENYDPNTKNWIEDNSYNNTLLFTRNLYSAYGSFSGVLKGIEYQLGLRGEITDRLVKNDISNEEYPVELFNYYPTVHFSKQLPKDQQLQVSYTRRINRPRPWELSPFQNYTDAYNTSSGNPYLKPEDIDSYEFNYLKRLKKGMVSAGLYHRTINDSKHFVTTIDSDNKMSITWENIGRTMSSGAEFMLNMKLGKKLSSVLSGNVFYKVIKGNVDKYNIDSESFSTDGRLMLTYSFKPGTRLQLNSYYSGPAVEGQGKREAMYAAGLGFSHDFMKRKATISVNASNIFKTQKYAINTITDDFKSYFEQKQEGPVLRISFSYRINNYQRRQQGNDMEIGGM